jgi:hypothetical protein
VLQVLGQEHRGHTAATHFAFNCIAVAKCRLKTFQKIGHGSLFVLDVREKCSLGLIIASQDNLDSHEQGLRPRA